MTQANNLRIFLVIWVGQLVSLLGTKMTRFALLIYIYQLTGQVTALALLGFFSFGATVIASPIAGYWVDRLDRRRVLLWADMGAGLVTVAYIVLLSNGDLAIWQLYAGSIVVGALDAFQTPAYTAATTMLIPKRHFARVSGMRSLALGTADIIAPMIAGALVAFIGVMGVMLIDVVTFIFAVLTLLLIRVPNPEPDTAADLPFRQQLSFGWRYIRQREGLFGLMLVMSVINLLAALTYFSIFPAMILARSGGDELALGLAEASLGVGGVIGSVLITVWGGPKRKIHGILAYTALSFALGDLVFGVGQSLPVWILGGLGASTFIPFIVAGNLAIWQAKVPPHLQGRVLSVQYAVRQSMNPIGFIAGGVLADFVFEPAMMVGGPLSESFGWLVGTGPGAGMGLMFIITGTLGALVGLGGYLWPALRNVERDLPDAI